MKILWVNPNFLHPTNKGGQIRTLEIVRRLHRRHEIHYVAFEDPAHREGPARAGEYSTHSYPVRHWVPNKQSLGFAAQLAANVLSDLPLALTRYRSAAMKRVIDQLIVEHTFDSIVCDFLFAAPNFSDLSECVLFQHNVETMIWKRHFESAFDPLRRTLFKTQAARMERYEAQVCRAVRHVIAVSEVDARRMEEMFGIHGVSATPTGVDAQYFTPAGAAVKTNDFVFVGSMDWMANIDGIAWFVNDILPLIRERRPDVTLTIAGRDPAPAVMELAKRAPGIRITGTVPDVREYFWNSKVCIVPLRVGGGTRLKIYEAMAAAAPVVSTTMGAEGLAVTHQRDIMLADTPGEFANACVQVLESETLRGALAAAGRQLVSSRFSWQHVTDQFEEILRTHSIRACASSSSR